MADWADRLTVETGGAAGCGRDTERSSPEALAELRRRLRAIRREVFAPRPRLVLDDEAVDTGEVDGEVRR